MARFDRRRSSFAKKLRRPARKADFAWRYLSNNYRALPHFLIVGAQKAGTTSLYNYLLRHPQIVPPYTKEVHFFDGGRQQGKDSFQKGISWYASHFPLNSAALQNKLTFEASPSYIFNPLAAQRIAAAMPQIKLVALLRDPADRAISHYWHEVERGREELPMMQAFEREEGRLKKAIKRGDYQDYSFVHHSYKKRGVYFEQIERYRRCFSWDQICVINSADFFADPSSTIKRVLSFLGLTPDIDIGSATKYNAKAKKQKPPNDAYQYLAEYFRDYNKLLYEVVGETYDWPD